MPRMLSLPAVAEPLICRLGPAFSKPSFQRFVLLQVGAVLAPARHTVTNCLRSVGSLAGSHPSSYHRLFSNARWSLWPLGRVLCAMVLELILVDPPAVVVVDDTTALHKGKCVFGKGQHHDACRSTGSHVVWVLGTSGWCRPCA